MSLSLPDMRKSCIGRKRRIGWETFLQRRYKRWNIPSPTEMGSPDKAVDRALGSLASLSPLVPRRTARGDPTQPANALSSRAIVSWC